MTAPSLRPALPTVVGAVVALLTVVVFVDARHNGFVYVDDPYYLTRNPWIAAGLTPETVRYALTSRDVWNWHPLTWWSHLLDVELFGLDPGPHHLVSVGLHAVAAWCVFAVARRIGARVGVAAFVALAFGLHPQRVESVVWASERKDVLCTLFMLATAWAHLALVDAANPRARRGWRLARFLAALAATMSKPMAVTLPFALLLLDLWPGRVPCAPRALLPRVVDKLELWVLSAVGAVLTVWAQQRMFPAPGSLAERVGDAAWAVCCYVAEFVAPVALSFSHPRADLRPGVAVIVGAVVVVVVLTGAALALLPKRPHLGVSWLWFVGLLVPTLGLVRVGSALYADRYSYLPSLGLIALAVFAVEAVVRDGRVRLALGVATLALWSSVTLRLVPVWASSASLVAHGLSVRPDDADLLGSLAGASATEGNLDAAFDAAVAAEQARPSAGTADFVGQVLLRRGKRAEARAAFARALTLAPDDVLPRLHLGELDLVEGELAAAVVHLERAVAVDRSRRTLAALARARDAAGDHAAAAALRAEAEGLPADPEYRGPRGAFPDPTPADPTPAASPPTSTAAP